MHVSVKSSVIHHFADDTNLLFSSKNPKVIKKTLNKELKHIFEWLCANRLSLNVTKSEFIIFRPPKKQVLDRIVLNINHTRIYESQKIKYLGIIMDPRLHWNHHINELSKKLNRVLGMIYKIRHDCTQRVLLSLYYSLFHSHLSYGLSVWGTTNKCYLSKISIIQKKVIRAITYSDFDAHTAPILKNLGILALNELIDYKIISLMWDYEHNTLPNSLAACFIRRNEIHCRNLRDTNKNKLYTASRCKNMYGFNSFSRQGSILWNRIKDLPFYNNYITKNTFLKKYKCTLLDAYWILVYWHDLITFPSLIFWLSLSFSLSLPPPSLSFFYVHYVTYIFVMTNNFWIQFHPLS